MSSKVVPADEVKIASSASRTSPLALGTLFVSILLCTGAHLLLKNAVMVEGTFVEKLFSLPVIVGLGVYGTGTVLWILCLRWLDLSFAYPASAMQYVLIVAGAWSLLGESIPWLRLVGVFLVIVGVLVLASEKTKEEGGAE
ncbi:MAG: small multidrug resistance protein [Verrucomicrobiota bacterium]